MADLTELERAALVAVVEAIVAEGGWIELSAQPGGAVGVAWWKPDLATLSYTQGGPVTLGPAIIETAERLGVAKRSGAAA